MRTLILSILILMATTACKTKKKTTVAKELGDSKWTVILLNQDVKPKSTQTLAIKGNIINGKGACNGFGGKLEKRGKKEIKFVDLIGTKMACELLNEENIYLQNLRKATSYDFVENNLVLYNDKKEVLVTFAPQ